MSDVKEFDLTDAADLVSQEYADLTAEQIREILGTFFKVTGWAVAKHSRVEYQGFGVLKLKMQTETSGIDPQGNPWTTPERLKVLYRPWLSVKHAIANHTGIPVV